MSLIYCQVLKSFQAESGLEPRLVLFIIDEGPRVFYLPFESMRSSNNLAAELSIWRRCGMF